MGQFEYCDIFSIEVVSALGAGIITTDGSLNTFTIRGTNFNQTNCNLKITDSEGNHYNNDQPFNPDRPSVSPLNARCATTLHLIAHGKHPKIEIIRPVSVTVTVTNNPSTRPALSSMTVTTLKIGP